MSKFQSKIRPIQVRQIVLQLSPKADLTVHQIGRIKALKPTIEVAGYQLDTTELGPFRNSPHRASHATADLAVQAPFLSDSTGFS